MKIVLDNRIRIKVKDLNKNLIRRIKEKFIHSNPDFFKKQALGFYTGNVERNITTYQYENEKTELSLPHHR